MEALSPTGRDPVRDFARRHKIEFGPDGAALRAVIRGHAEAPTWLLHMIERDMLTVARQAIAESQARLQVDDALVARIEARHAAASRR